MTAKPPEKIKSKTPAELGFHLPAEWERHEATWIGWPHERSDWPGKFAPIPWVYGEIVRRIAPNENVRILVNDKAHEARARAVLEKNGVGCGNVEFFRLPTNRGWTRDFGPFFIRRAWAKPEVAMTAFRFNAWAKYKNWLRDDAIPNQLAKKLDLKLFRATLECESLLSLSVGGSKGATSRSAARQNKSESKLSHSKADRREIVLEGGSIDVNGRGSLLTTEECLLDQKVQTRNPGVTRGQMEKVLRDYLGVRNILWLGRGIEGDDTHGHIDDLARFTGPRTIAICSEKNPRDENYAALEENRERLEGMRLEDGAKPEVIPLPMPAPLYFEGRRLPASYANFYICNAAVLVPTFNDPNDRAALGILSELFPDRRVIGIHAVDLVWGLGTLHCLTKEQTAVDAS